MGDVYLYGQNCEDFTTLGLCGRLSPTLCEFDEIANGMSELKLEHPIDENGRYRLLIPGRIIKAVVPVREIPELDDETQEYVKTVQVWRVSASASKLERTVFNKRDDQEAAQKAAAQEKNQAAAAAKKARKDSGEDVSDEPDNKIDVDKLTKKKLTRLKAGRKVTVLKTFGDNIPEYKIRAGKVTGYIDSAALTYVETRTYSGPDTTADISAWYESTQATWKAKEQLFRIVSAKVQNDKVVVEARHIFYDNLYRLSTYQTNGSLSLKNAYTRVLNNLIGETNTVFHTNITGTRVGAYYRDKNLVEIILDPEDGLAARWGADVIRDDFDVYLIGDAGFNRGVVLTRGRDLTGVTYDVDWENIATKIRPVGETKDGEPLYLQSTDGLVQSPRDAQYPFGRVAMLKVAEARVSDELTTAEARRKMKAAAKEMIANGCDMPTIKITVNFQQLGDTMEYAPYKGLKNLFLFDTVRIVDNQLGVDVSAKITRIVWDCLLERLTDVELGTVESVMPSVASFQLPSNINGTKIYGGSLTAGGLAGDTIAARHIQADSIYTDALQAQAITTAKIAAAAVTADQIAAGAITAEKLSADAVSTKLLTAMNAVIQELDAGHAEVDDLEAAFATVQVLEAGAATFDRATVQHLVSNALTMTFGTGTDVFIENLRVAYAQMVSATIGNLCVKASDGNYYTIDVSQGGLVTATLTTVTPAEKEAGQTTGGRTILDTDITAANLSTASLLATYGLVNQLDAARIDVDQLVARQAFIQALNTSLITGNEIIELMISKGGRNLFINTNTPDVSDAANYPRLRGQTANTTARGTVTAAEHGMRSTSTSSLTNPYPLIVFGSTVFNSGALNGLEPGETYTLSFDYTVQLYSGASVSGTRYFRAGIAFASATDTGWDTSLYRNLVVYNSQNYGAEVSGRCWWTFTLPETAAKVYIRLFASSTTSGYHAAGDFIEAANLKIERGEVATSWTCAPEDIGEAIDAVDAAAQDAAAAAQDAVTALDEDISNKLQLKTDGLHIVGYTEDAEGAQTATGGEVLIDSAGMNVVVNGQTYSRFAGDYAQFGNYQIRRPKAGGLVFKKKG